MMKHGEERRPVRVAVIEDQREIREGLAFLINATPGYRCTGTFDSMEQALNGTNGISRELPDVILLDLGLPGMTGIEGARILTDRWPEIPVVALTVYQDDKRIFEVLCAGASGYLLKNTPPANILESVRQAVDGGSPMSPEVASRVLSLFRQIRPPKESAFDLTAHELRLLGLLVEGHSYRSAAEELHCSIHTVSFHIKNIYRKLQVHSKSKAVAKAIKEHLC